MTRTDLMLEVARVEWDITNLPIQQQETTKQELLDLIVLMHNKIERVYTVVFTLEENDIFSTLGSVIRKALEA